MTTNTFKILIAMSGLVFILNFTGCDEGGGITIPSGASELTVSVKSDDNITDAALVITQIKALITDVEFEKESNGKDELHQRGPIAATFNTDGSLTTLGTQYIIRDIYTKAKFVLHKPEENETVTDPEFKEGTGESQRYSFIVKGTYNGNSFVYKSKKSASIVILFDGSENLNLKTANITIAFNKLKWFKNGPNEINPSDPLYENQIDDNIKNSFMKVFRDDDKNGQPDN
ncbi:MAG: hypothetical protein EHM58_17060 [Ignavibacteriae bacterium]|nr:MAG: hypothetical protein EHM58_17060 [Ignavibacteriota bacterium]